MSYWASKIRARSGAAGSPVGRRHLLDHRLQDVVDADPLLGRAEDDLEGVEPEVGVDLLAHPLDLGRGEVDLVDDRHDLQVVLEGEVEVGDGLRLDPLGGVDDEQRPLGGHQRAAHLVGEVDVAGGVDQVQPVGLAVPRGVPEGDGVALDGDAALALDIHRVEDLVAELARLHAAAALDQPVGQRRFAVVDVGDDAEITDVIQDSLPLCGPGGSCEDPTTPGPGRHSGRFDLK